jgi:hypothetical protein
MGWMRKKWVRALGIVLGVLVLAVVAIAVFLPSDKIRDMALAQARQKLGRDITMGDAGVSFGGGLGVKLNDLVVHNPAGMAGDPLADVEAIDLKLAIGPLFKGEIQISRLIIGSPRLNLILLDDGTNNYTFAPVEPAPAAGPTKPEDRTEQAPVLSIDNFSIQDGRLDFTTGGQTTTLHDISAGFVLTTPIEDQFQVQGDLAARTATFSQFAESPELPLDFDYDLIWDNGDRRLDLRSLLGTVAGFALTGQGQVLMDPAGPTTELEIKTANQDLGSLWQTLLPLLPPEQRDAKLGGLLLSSVTRLTIGPGEGLDAVTYAGVVELRNLSFSKTDLVDELKQGNISLGFRPDEFIIMDSSFQFNSGYFQLAGSLRDPLPYFLPPEMQGDGPIPRPHLEFNLRAADLDIDRLMPAASPSGQEVAGGTKGEPLQLDMEFPDLTAAGTFQADRMAYMQVSFTDISGQVAIADRVLTISDVRGRVFEGAITAQAAIDLNDLNNPGYSGEYQAQDIEVDGFVTRFAGVPGLLLGKTSMSGNFATHGLDPEVIRNSLTFDSDASLVQGRLVTRDKIRGSLGQLAEQTGYTIGGEQVVSDLFTHIKVEDGKVAIQNLKTGLGDLGDLHFGGQYAFSGELDYTGSLILTPQQTDKLFARGVMAQLSGLLGDKRPSRLTIPLSVTGTRNNPKIQLDLAGPIDELQKKYVAEKKNDLEEKAKEEVKKGLEGLLKKLK